jgi:hypothetical protein
MEEGQFLTNYYITAPEEEVQRVQTKGRRAITT